MFGVEFFPTPSALVQKMISKVNFKDVRTVLEPSAGKGDIAKALMKRAKWDSYGNRPAFTVDAIEIDENLRHILKGENLRVVHDDFLDFQTYMRYDLIVMNPPFSEGDRHLQKAIEIMRYGGQIVCILNAETIRNPYTRLRGELVKKLGALEAEIEYISNAFSDAEHPTDVEIALVYVNIPRAKEESVILDHLRKAAPIAHQDHTYKGIIPSDYIEGLIQQYNAESQAGLALIDDYLAMQPMLLDSVDGKYRSPVIKMEVKCEESDAHSIHDRFVESIRYKYWKELFSSKEITSKLTSNLQSELHGRVKEFMAYEFSVFNIFQLLEDLSRQTGKAVEETIINLFDDFVRYGLHDGSDNVHYYNGWRTNSSHKVGKKVIVPWFKAWESWSDEFRPDGYRVLERLNDIEKVFDFLDGKRTAQVDLCLAMQFARSTGQNRKIPTKYFLVTFYKKGTCHLEFLDERLLKKFNLFGSQRKNWLPPSYGKKAYQEMDPEERAVVDSFEGRGSYEEVMNDREYFIVKENSFAMLGAGEVAA